MTALTRSDRWKLPTFDQDDQDKITDLLMGHKVSKVTQDTLELDDGTLLLVVPNEGGCSCGAGDYDLTALNGIDNIITKVEFDNEPSGDDSGKPWDAPNGHYRIFVFADNEKVNLLTVEGDDGNGYYGTGFEIVVKAVSA